MKVKDLTDEEKKIVRNTCYLIPARYEVFSGEKLPTSIKELQERTARQFLRYRRCGHTIDYFYRHNDTFAPELSMYAANSGRVQSVMKRLRILRHFGVKHVVDFGSGIGIDAIVYARFGISSTCVEFKNPSREFAKYLRDQDRFKRMIKFQSPEKFIHKLTSGDKEYDAIQAIEVVAHVESPYYLFSMFMKHSRLVMWTNDIDVKRGEHRDPQHLPHSLKLVLESLDKYGRKVKIEGMAIPPRVWVSNADL